MGFHQKKKKQKLTSYSKGRKTLGLRSFVTNFNQAFMRLLVRRYISIRVMSRFKAYLIVILLMIPAGLDYWTDGANFTLGCFAAFFLGISVYGCLKVPTPSIPEGKIAALKLSSILLVLLSVSAWGVWYFLSNPFDIVQADGSDVYSGIVGLMFLGPLLFFVFLSSKITSTILRRKNITS